MNNKFPWLYLFGFSVIWLLVFILFGQVIAQAWFGSMAANAARNEYFEYRFWIILILAVGAMLLGLVITTKLFKQIRNYGRLDSGD